MPLELVKPVWQLAPTEMELLELERPVQEPGLVLELQELPALVSA